MELHGLQATEKNGLRWRIDGIDQLGTRLQIRMDVGGTLLVRMANLRLLDMQQSPAGTFFRAARKLELGAASRELQTR